MGRSRAEEARRLKPGRREMAKAERRQHIILVARELIRETGDAGLSMRALASRAGVSLATTYNLFGSKRALLLSVLDDIREFSERFSQHRMTDPLDRLFSAVDICIEMYVEVPQFNRATWAALFDPSDDFRSQTFNSKRAAFWQGLLQDVATSGALRPDLDVEMLFKSLDRSFSATMFDWVTRDLSDAQLGPTMRYGHALILLGAATPECWGHLEARVLSSQRVLQAAVRERVGRKTEVRL